MYNNTNCRGCGAPLDLRTAQGGIVVCPYCNTQNIVNIPQEPVARPATPPVTQPVVPQQPSEVKFYHPGYSIEQFEADCQNIFDNNELLPDDIFREINFKEVKCYYVPTYVLSARCKGSIQYKDGSEIKYWNYDNHEVRNVLATPAGKLPSNLHERLSLTTINSTAMRDTMTMDKLKKEAEAGGFTVIENHVKLCTARATFENGYNWEVLHWATDEKHLSNPVTNLKYTHDEIDDINDVLEYVPYYYVEFTYKNNVYFLASDSVSGGNIIHCLPEDLERKVLLNEVMPNWALFSICAIVFLPPLMWLFGPLRFGTLLWLIIPAGIAIGIISFIGTSQTNAKKKAVLDEALRRRQENKNV